MAQHTVPAPRPTTAPVVTEVVAPPVAEKPAQTIAEKMGWVLTPATAAPSDVRGATAELRELSAYLISVSPEALRQPTTSETKLDERDLGVLRKLLGAEGYRFKVREGMFPVSEGSGTLVLCTVISAHKRADKKTEEPSAKK